MINKDIYWCISIYLPYYEINKLVINKETKALFDNSYYNYRAKIIYNYANINNLNDMYLY